jgi:hypothetical protein
MWSMNLWQNSSRVDGAEPGPGHDAILCQSHYFRSFLLNRDRGSVTHQLRRVSIREPLPGRQDECSSAAARL